jgi:hypothetical protein
MTATRAAIAGAVTVALWGLRVAARVLRMLADLMVDVADLADRARSRPTTGGRPSPAQPALMP